jgi:Cytochrome c7 and related cytochrome c
MRLPRCSPRATTRRFLAAALFAIAVISFVALHPSSIIEFVAAQTRRPTRVSRPAPNKQQAPRGSAEKYSAFLHSSDSHKPLACNACHKVPTGTANRDFPDVADFPDHDACVRCHRQQFFTRQSFIGNGPAICTICHFRPGPRQDARFVFGQPNGAKQAVKPKDERQFTIEFPHDKHQNVIASLRSLRSSPHYALADARATAPSGVRFVRAAFTRSDDNQKADYNNCSICHITNKNVPDMLADSFKPRAGTFKTMPRAHDACFDCHWKGQQPVGEDCAGCHKPTTTFVPVEWPTRKSAKFSHDGGEGEHVMECTTCHINITRASTLRGLTPDVPVTACATCHKDSKKTTYPKMTTIEEEITQFKKTSNCTYCHSSEVGKRKAPASHSAAVQ